MDQAPKKRKGFFITFEGLEGAGKSVQAGLLGSRLREMGYTIVATREPGGTRIGEQIRTITHNPENVDLTGVTEAYLMATSRAQHVREIIKPALEEGKIVISDRYLDSSIAYQGFGREMGEESIYHLNTMAVEGIIPHLTIILAVSPEVGIGRRNSSQKVDRLDLQQRAFYDRVQAGYEILAQKNPHRIRLVDGSKSINEVAMMVWEVVKPHLPHL